MANKFLESITEEQKDLKKIRSTLEKIYEVEVKEEKRETLTQKREEQKSKRSRGDTKLKIKDLLGIKKSDEKKAKKGLLDSLGGMLKGILSIGAKPLLVLAGIGIVGGVITAYIKSKEFRDGVNQHILIPMGKVIVESLPGLLATAVMGASDALRITGNAEGSNNPQEETEGTKNTREAREAFEKFFGRQEVSQKTREARAIQQSLRYQVSHYGTALFLPGGIDSVDRKLQNFYLESTSKMDEHLLLLDQADNMDGQLQNIKRAMLFHDGHSPTYKRYTKQIVELEANLKAKSAQIVKSEANLRAMAQQEAKLKQFERDSMGENHGVHPSAFAGSQFEHKQKGGPLKDENDPRTKLGLMENKDYDQKSPLFQGVLMRQSGGLVLFGGHTDVPAGHSQPGTDAPGTDLQGKYKPTAEQHFVNEVGKAINRIAKQKNVPVNYRFAKGRYASTSDPNSNWGQINAIRRSGGSAMDLHFDAYGYEGGRLIQGARGVISNGFSLTGTEQKMVGKFGRHPTGSSFGVPIIELDPINRAPANVTNYANMIVDAMEGVEGNYTEKGGTTNTNTGSQDNNVSPSQQREIQQAVKQSLNPVDMIKGMATSLGKLGGPMGEFVSGALGQVATAFQGTLVAKKQKGGFVGNYKTAYDGLRRRFPEAKPHHVVGAMANFETEAPGIKPNTKQLKGGPGRGIAQWEVPHAGNPTGRWAKAEQMYGKGVINSLPQQLDFVKWEMNTGHPLPDGRPNLPWGRNAKKAWLQSKTSKEATINFLRGYEAPSVEHMDRRLANAKKFNSQAAVEESRKRGSGSTKATAKNSAKPWWRFGMQNGGVVGMSQNYHLNNLMEQMDTGPILVPIPVSGPTQGLSIPSPGMGSVSTTGSNDSYRISMGAAFS